MKEEEFILKIPKVELHVHLEGSVTPEFWLDLYIRHSEDNSIPSIDDLRKRFQFGSFNDFISAFRDVIFTFRTPEDFYYLTLNFLNRAADQNIRYCEVMFTPWFLEQRGIDFYEMMSEIDRAAIEIEKKRDVKMKLIFDGPRNFGSKVVKDVFQKALNDKTGRVIGVGLGGDEKNFPALDFIDQFEFARANGLKTIAHAGETDGENSMINAIEKLQVSRIGHCLGITKNSRLEELIQENKITLDLCPLSNVATRVINKISDHPFHDYLKRGYPITINSDDPGFFKTDLVNELLEMNKLKNLSFDEIAKLSQNAVQGSFLTKYNKEKILSEIDKMLIEVKDI
jgi:adenosine deaminase